MKYYREVQLKNGKLCILRSPTGEEASSIIDHMRITSDETDNMLRYPDEITISEEEEKLHINQVEISLDSIMISAFVDDKIVGNAELRPVFSLEKGKHRADFGISIQQKYWNMGIGTQLVSALLEVAEQAGFEQVELDVVTDNVGAVALYKKLGFKIFGTNKWAYKKRNGQYQEMHYMYRRFDNK